MILVEFGKTSTHKLWKYVLTDWEGDTYECPKCGFETITNEGAEPAFNYCPMCGKKMCIDEKNFVRKENRKTYMRDYQQKRRKDMKGGAENDVQ